MEELKSVVLRAQSGDLDSYGELVRRFQDMAYGYAYSILGDFHLAEDAAQEAFIQAYRNLESLQQPIAFPGWFRTIVFKHCDRLTRRRRVSQAPLEVASGMRSSEPSPVEVAERRETKDSVLTAIRSLPENQRTVTTLFYINGYSQKDIAEFLEVPVTTVNNRLHASRKRLKERMVGMVEETLKSNAPDERFSRTVIEELIAWPRPLEIEGHPVRQIWELIRAALPDYEVIQTEEVVSKKALPAMVRNHVDSKVFDRIAYRPSENTLLRSSMPLSTLTAIQGRTPPVRLLVPGRVFNASGWPKEPGISEAPDIKIGHVCHVTCIERGFSQAAFRATIEKVIRAALGSFEVDFKWGKADDCPDKPVHRKGMFSVKHKGNWRGICRGGILTSEILRQAGYDPSMVSGADFGFGLDRLALCKFGIEDIRTLWRPPYVPHREAGEDEP